ncbi:MAG: hypothetical protein KAW47_06780 [Thermoplasmatales archaeon]|nr:hypothetical protein [Thermoplasmatales archaeon]
MADFTNMSREQIKVVLDGFKHRVNDFLSNLETLMEIYGENTITREILDDALAVRKGETTIAKIHALHEGRKIGTKSRSVLEHRRDVSATTLLPEFKHRAEILGMGVFIPYKFAESMESSIFEELMTYHHVGMIPVSGREGIDIYRDRAKYKIPMEYFTTKREDEYGKREISCA